MSNFALLSLWKISCSTSTEDHFFEVAQRMWNSTTMFLLLKWAETQSSPRLALMELPKNLLLRSFPALPPKLGA